MPHKDPIAKKEWYRKYRLKNKEKLNAYRRQWSKSEEFQKNKKEYYLKTREKQLKYWVEYSTEANADAALVNLMSDMKSGKKSETNVITTETPAQTTTDATTVAPQSTEPQSTSNSSGEVNTYLTGILGLK
jgi:hypothetical protein